MTDEIRKFRVKSMMHRFFSLYEQGNSDFSLVRELLYEDGFVWNSPSGNLIGIDAFEASFNELNKEWKHSHNAEAMHVELLDTTKARLSFDYIYQHLQGDRLVLHAKGHYELLCIDRNEKYPRIQKCDLTLTENIEGGEFNDVTAQNIQLHRDYAAKAGISLDA